MTNPESNGSAVASGDKYVKLTQLEHILRRPDTYIGSTELTTETMWVINESNSLEQKPVTFVPGLLKIFDEILVNAADNKIRDPSMKKIDVIIDPESNTIQVKNDGKGIPIEIHQKEKIYVPELIFGHLLTSSNYDDDEKKVTGGRNGYGAKLCNIFSTFFELETSDAANAKNYIQVWQENMSIVNKPKISKFLKKNGEFTRIAFKPDLQKFNMSTLDSDTVSLLKRRVYDIAGCVKGVQVTLNGEKIPLKDFKAYIKLYLDAAKEQKQSLKAGEADESNENDPPPTIVYDKNERWEIAFALSETSFNQVSFVNSIATTSGGTHVNYIADQIVNKTMDYLKKKHKNAHVKPFQIRNNMFLFVNCLIENPAFTSQTKEQMITKISSFGSKFVISEDFIKKVIKTEFIQQILDVAQANADKALKKSDGLGRKNRVIVPKLEDANRAGTKDSEKCTLILTEGDSAKALAVAGLKVVGRDFYGVFPLRGKLLNVRDATTDQIMKNQEIKYLKQIIGLQHKKHYDSVKGLRYGHIMIMTDQDFDGSHIKGLVINFIESSFPGLLNIPGFLLEFITPIVKVTLTRNKQQLLFYTMPEYENWLENGGSHVSFKSKYYKGLGTSDGKDMMKYFNNLDHHIKCFDVLKNQDKALIDLAFAKKKADERKSWLAGFELGTHLDPNLKTIPYDDFINKELILFSMADNIRSIPSLFDGFKPAQRKVLYTFFKRNITKELKVNDLQGYVSSTSNYHHGDASLIQTIVGLAQDYIGSNNIYLLTPNGCFGTRDAGGKDHAAARYIYTELNKVTKAIFREEDNKLLNYIKDDEKTVEPYWYLPVIPMILVNGAEGIGTGWSTSIPQYNPTDIASNLRKLLKGEEMIPLIPWFRNWRGSMHRVAHDKFKMYGRVEKVDNNTLIISEIPAKTWTSTIKEFIENSLANTNTEKNYEKFIQNYTEQDDLEGHKFIITLSDEQMRKTEKIGIYERFKLVQNISLSNMILFNERGKLQKFVDVLDIIKAYYYVRLEYYQKRKDYLVESMRQELTQLSAKARFVKLIIEKELKISNRKRAELVQQLQNLEFPRFGKDGKLIKGKVLNADITLEEGEVEQLEINENDKPQDVLVEDDLTHVPDSIYSSYDYLLNMPLWSLTKERYEKLLSQQDEKQKALDLLLTRSAKDLWIIDLDEFDIAYEKFLKADTEKFQFDEDIKPTASVKRKRARKIAKDEGPAKKVRKKAKKETDDEDLIIRGEYITPEIKEPKAKKSIKVKKEESAPVESDTSAITNDSTMKKEITLDLIKKEVSPEDRFSSLMNSAKDIFSLDDDEDIKMDKNTRKTNSVSKDVVILDYGDDDDDDIFSKFNTVADKFDESETKSSNSASAVSSKSKSDKGSSSIPNAKPKKRVSTKKKTKTKTAVDDNSESDFEIENSENDDEQVAPILTRKRPTRRAAKPVKIESTPIFDSDKDEISDLEEQDDDDEEYIE